MESIDRRGFLRLFGIGAAGIAATQLLPAKKFFFFGDIFRVVETPQIYTLADMAKAMDPDGHMASIAELLNQTNSILEDVPWIESRMPIMDRRLVWPYAS